MTLILDTHEGRCSRCLAEFDDRVYTVFWVDDQAHYLSAEDLENIANVSEQLRDDETTEYRIEVLCEECFDKDIDRVLNELVLDDMVVAEFDTEIMDFKFRLTDAGREYAEGLGDRGYLKGEN